MLVVAADDGVMPQTIEAINHAKAAEVPIVVAVNKIDRENADPQRVLTQLAEQGLVPESWGGDTITVEMSALQNLGVDDLLDQLLVVAELEELTANPTGPGQGRRPRGQPRRRPRPGGHRPGRQGHAQGRRPDRGRRGLGQGPGHARRQGQPDQGGRSVDAGAGARPVGRCPTPATSSAPPRTRRRPGRWPRPASSGPGSKNQRADARVQKGVKLEDIFTQIQKGEVATLNLVLKADVQGSLEALTESLRKLERDDVRLVFVHRAVGGITENDITLAATTNATIIGFNVRPDRKARELAEAEDVEIRTYEIIYQILEDIERAMVGLLAPEFEEVVTGRGRGPGDLPGARGSAPSPAATCARASSPAARKVRFLRDGVIIWKGTITSLKRFKDDAREVREGFECGIGLSDFQDLKQGDLIETFEEREIAARR